MKAFEEAFRLPLPEPGFCAFCSAMAETPPWPAIVEVRDGVLVFVPPEQRGPLHVLVSPVRHAPTVLDLSGGEVNAVFCRVQQVARAVVALTRPTGVHVFQNNGTGAEQTVPHLHVHVVARWTDQNRSPFGPADKLTLDERAERASQLRSAL